MFRKKRPTDSSLEMGNIRADTSIISATRRSSVVAHEQKQIRTSAKHKPAVYSWDLKKFTHLPIILTI
jgi:hypothetical protein